MAAGNDVARRTADDRSPEGVQPEVLEGPFDVKELLHLDEALTAAERDGGGLHYSVYVGPLHDPVRGAAETMHDRLSDPDKSVLIAVSPEQRKLEIVTGKLAQDKIPDRSAALVVFSMEAAFGAGNLAEGVVTGLRMLAETARGALPRQRMRTPVGLRPGRRRCLFAPTARASAGPAAPARRSAPVWRRTRPTTANRPPSPGSTAP